MMRRMNRRKFLHLAGLGAGFALSGGLVPDVMAAPGQRRHNWVTVFRLSTHGRRNCRACKAHGANRFFRTEEKANLDRAHLGCNCGIVRQRIPPGLARNYFRRGDVYDKRHKFDPPKRVNLGES
jgi:hypothetical protein